MHGAHGRSRQIAHNLREFVHIMLAPQWVFVIIFLICSIFTAVASPVGIGMDEPSHISRIMQLSEGHLLSEPVKGIQKDERKQLWGGEVDEALITDLMANTREFYLPEHVNDRYAFPAWNDARIRGNEDFSGKKVESVFSNSALYSPVTYLPHIIAAELGKIVTKNITVFVLILRLAGILFLSVVIFLCIKYIPIGKWALTVISLLPGTISVNAFVSGDTVLFAAITSFATALLLALSRKGHISRTNRIVLMLSCFTIGLAKMAYLPIILLLLLLIPIVREARIRTVIGVSSIILVSVLSFAIWYLLVRHINSGIMYGRNTDPSVQVGFILAHPLQYADMLIHELFRHNYFMLGYSGIFSELGRTTVPTSGWISVLALIAAPMALDKNERNSLQVLSKYRRLICVAFTGVLGMILVLVETSVFLQFTTAGANEISGIQPRYFMPLLILVMIMLILVLESGEMEPQQSDRRERAIPGIFCISLQLLSAALYLVTVVSSIFM
ncbi:DUF2142 domain-containing protein [Bifidobacterium sp. SO4]|uniref:DUF2142 domain-containing protein n=1 Tax=Bifidobacterium sp. SO4 TaxID=2809030 RepID=UPI001BDCCF99|nr:DUF2142 domain-containing protein [Bifidobacterium sp. SO4]MBT1171735.1 DUF2142 domain-containing protein [Bifidobacterium sp. SO4]